jgi:hypothetical protein
MMIADVCKLAVAVDGIEIYDVVLSYLKKNPSDGHCGGVGLVPNAINSVFPCPAK